jgi:hypothetical protein
MIYGPDKVKFGLTTATAYFPSDIRTDRDSDREPFRMKTRRIATCLTEPIRAIVLNGACQQNNAETRGE